MDDDSLFYLAVHFRVTWQSVQLLCMETILIDSALVNRELTAIHDVYTGFNMSFLEKKLKNASAVKTICVLT